MESIVKSFTSSCFSAERRVTAASYRRDVSQHSTLFRRKHTYWNHLPCHGGLSQTTSTGDTNVPSKTEHQRRVLWTPNNAVRLHGLPRAGIQPKHCVMRTVAPKPQTGYQPKLHWSWTRRLWCRRLPTNSSHPERDGTTYLRNQGSCLDTDGRGPEQLRLRIRSAIRPDGHPVHVGETRHRGQVVC